MVLHVRRSGAQRRAEIADAALVLLGRGGLSQVTAAALAAEVGVSPGAPFRHFRSLDAVVAAAVDLAAARLAQGLPPEDARPLARLEALARARVALLQERPGIAWLLRSDQAAGALPPEAVETLERTIRDTRDVILRALREGAACGEVRADLPAEVLLAIFTATVHSLVGPRGLSHRAAHRPASDRVLTGLFVLLGAPAPEDVP